VEAGLEMGNGEEEEDRPGLDGRTRLPPVLQVLKTPASVRVVGGLRRSDPSGSSGVRASPPPPAAAPPLP
jgi:hypothetical protein